MNKKILYLLKIRAISCFAIILLHTFTMYNIVYKDTLSSTDLYITKLVPWLMMWAVPCFLMVSGVLLLDTNREMPIKKIFYKYILRMVLVLILMITIFYIVDELTNHNSFEWNDVTTVGKKIVEDGSWAHLWYIYLLIGIYLLLPLYRIIAKHTDNQTMIYICIIAIFFISIIPFLETMTNLSIGFTIGITSIFPIYLFLGYMIHNKILNINVWINVLFTIVGIGMIILLSKLDFGEHQAQVEKLLGNYAFFPIVILSIGMFGLFNKTDREYNEESTSCKIWSFFDKYSFGIYLIHLIFLRTLIKVIKFNPFEYGIWMLLVIAIGVYICSLITMIIIKHIPLLKKLF